MLQEQIDLERCRIRSMFRLDKINSLSTSVNIKYEKMNESNTMKGTNLNNKTVLHFLKNISIVHSNYKQDGCDFTKSVQTNDEIV